MADDQFWSFVIMFAFINMGLWKILGELKRK